MKMNRPVVHHDVDEFSQRIGLANLEPKVGQEAGVRSATLAVVDLTGEAIEDTGHSKGGIALVATPGQRLAWTSCFIGTSQRGLAIISQLVQKEEDETCWLVGRPQTSQFNQAQFLPIVAVG